MTFRLKCNIFFTYSYKLIIINMNILKPEWFKRRKYGGWGITPVTWQGWVFMLVLIAPLIIISTFFKEGMSIKGLPFIAFSAYIAFIIAIVMSIMLKIKLDEREIIHEAISDRNALWVMLFIIAIGVVAEGVSPEIVRSFPINIFALSALIAAWLTKLVSIIYLDNKD